MADAPLFRLDGVSKSFKGRVVLDVPELAVEAGGICVIRGPNGAGKSVLLNILAMLLEPDQGRVFFRGRELQPGNGAAHRRNITLVAQDPYMFHGTVERNVAMGLAWRGVDRTRRKAEAMRALEMVGLAGSAGLRAQRLSGGERQRTALARAVAMGPDVLLLDEPFAALDEKGAALCEDLVCQLAQDGVSIVMVLHSADQTSRLARAVITMERGRVV